MEESRIIGHVVAVHGFRVKVELTPDVRSSSRATPDGVFRAIAINSYLLFDLGAGNHAIGILTDLHASETYDPAIDDELSLKLTKPKRIASVQLLGTFRQNKDKSWQFDTGITILPTLDTPAEVANSDVLEGLFSFPPKRNKPQDCDKDDYDTSLEIGYLTRDENTKFKVSFNDIFSRPLAVVGNTGSGKSYTVASLLNSMVSTVNESGTVKDPHVFVLDINGEYANAFLENSEGSYEREPNKLYLNGEEFCIPAWLMNGEEICYWLRASEGIQEPVLKDWWAIAKSNSGESRDFNPLEIAVLKVDNAISWLDLRQPVDSFLYNIELAIVYSEDNELQGILDNIDWSQPLKPEWKRPNNEPELRVQLQKYRRKLVSLISERQNEGVNFAKSADSPYFVDIEEFRDPILVDRSVDSEDNKRIDQYLMTLKLRLRTRLDDKRWQSFFSYERLEIKSFKDWLSKLGFGAEKGNRITVLDLSMLASEVLPFACAIVGRLLLETREMLSPEQRNNYPWILVLEEAHNYVRPPRIHEDKNISLSRGVFERVAKEGRKFGLSLIVASQRPSEISQTIISQCANFFTHRLQNPDDIDHFRRIIPKQAQRLLDQVTVLANGEAIVFGSSVHVPSRVQINKPEKVPWSSTAAPYLEWVTDSKFPLDDVLENWGLSDNNSETENNSTVDDTENTNHTEIVSNESKQPQESESEPTNDDIPF